MIDAQLAIRVDADLRAAFLGACKGQDQTAAQAVRAFMREYVAQHGQQSLPMPKPKGQSRTAAKPAKSSPASPSRRRKTSAA